MPLYVPPTVADAPRASTFGGFFPAATHPAILGAATESNGTDTVGMFRARHIACQWGLSGVRLLFTNTKSGDTAGTSELTVRAGVENAAGTPFPVFFDGKRSVVIEPGGWVWSDEVGLYIAPGVSFCTRTNVTVASSGKWPTQLACIYTGDGFEAGTSANDRTTSGTVTGLTNGTPMYGPAAVCSGGVERPSVAIGGDSIAGGQGDGYSAPDAAPFQHSPYADAGWILRALNGGFGYVSLAKVAEAASPTVLGSMRLALAKACKYAALPYGTNNVYGASGNQNLATLQANVLAPCAQTSSSGTKPIVATLIPITSSSDLFISESGQTAHTNVAAHLLFNAWLRAGAPVHPTTKAAVAIGTVGALLAAVYGPTGLPVTAAYGTGHPIWAVADPAANVESVVNPGKHRIITGTADIVNGTKNLTNVTGGPFYVNDTIRGTGVFAGTTVTAVGAGTLTVSNDCTATATATPIQLVIASDGTHPSTGQATRMALAFPTGMLT